MEEECPEGLNDVERAMWLKRKHQEAEDEERVREFLEKREKEKREQEEELEELKEKQARRREERAEENRLIQERARKEEARRRQEEEDRKAALEEEKRKRDERRKKVGGGGIPGFTGPAGTPNYSITKVDKSGKKGAAAKKGLTEEELAMKKAEYVANHCHTIDFSAFGTDSLKDKIKELHARIAKLEADKYDLEKRHEGQDYDLKELAERQRQMARNKALAKGLDSEEAANSPHPPKLNVQSKYDRQTDRRTYAERKDLYAKPKAKPPPSVFHGSARPPDKWGRKETEELENIRKILEPPKYQEAVKVEGAKPPMAPIPVKMPDPDPEEAASVEEPPPPRPAPKAPEPEPEPEEATAEAEEEEEEEEEE